MKSINIARISFSIAFLLVVTPTLAASSPRWSAPFNVSGWQKYMEPYRFTAGTDGSHAFFYPIFDASITSSALWGRVRDPGGNWSSSTNISGEVKPTSTWFYKYWDAGVSPDGTAWVVWTLLDKSAPAGKDSFMVESHRPPGGAWSAPHRLSPGNAAIRWVDFHIGPEGQVAAAWVECDTTSTNMEQGNCSVYVSRRSPGEPNWKPRKKVDKSSTGVNEVYVRVGPGGLVIVLWTEGSSAFNPPRFKIMASEYLPVFGWRANPITVSGWEQPRQENLLSDPVMDGGGTLTTAWYSASPPGSSSKSAIFSKSRTIASGWPVNSSKICADSTHTLTTPRLAVSEDGTVAAMWWRSNSMPSNSQAVSANARDPGGNWSAAEEILSTWEDDITLAGVDIWPGGTAVFMWSITDGSRPDAADSAVFWNSRHGGVWGGGGQGQLGDWEDVIAGAAFKLSPDGSGAATWAVKKSKNKNSVMASIWPPGGPWDPPVTIASGYNFTAVHWEGMALGAGGRDFGAVWYAGDNSTPSLLAFMYASTAAYNQFIPLSIK
jgi:hypothetical protein